MLNPVNAGRADELRCDDFLASHSDYMDGLLPVTAAARLESHMDECASCARYDRILRRSLDLVHELPDITPDADFEQRLQHRIFHIQDRAALGEQRGAGVAAGLAVAAALALLAWSPMMFDRPAIEPNATMIVHDAGYAALGVNAPVTGNAIWHTALPAPTVPVMVQPGPYAPLVVQPPAHRSVRSVSTGYAPVR